MADKTPASASSGGAPSGGSASAQTRRSGAHRTSDRRGGARGQNQAAMRRGHGRMSTRDVNAILSEMGSYTKYSKVVNDCKFDVKLRCQCGRSRNMSWMFLCTVCATGTKVEKAEEESGLSKYGYGSLESPLLSSSRPTSTKADKNQENKEEEQEDDHKQRPFLCCDLCAHKITETYYCPNCLNAYPAQYVKQQTRCPRCVACPICVSPLEKIVYADSATTSSKDKEKAAEENKDDKDKDKEKDKNDETATATSGADGKKDSLVAPGKEKLVPETTKIGSKGKSSDVYLYQCPFCFWSSNTVGLKAPSSDVLNQNLTKKIKKPYDDKLEIMAGIEEKYNNMNEELRKEEERLYNARHYHKTYKTKNLFDLSGTGSAPKKRVRKRKTSLDFDFKGDGTNPLTLARVMSGGPESANAMQRLKKKLESKYNKNHVLDKDKADNSHVPKLDMIFVSAFNIQHVSPLFHRLQDPLHQHTDFHKFVPQRFHLMTKESFKCPNKVCEQYVCKPHLRGAQANFEKRTAVLDFLPRVVVEVVSGDLIASATSTILVKFQNRHMEDAKLTIDCGINESDAFSSAKVECSTKQFEMDPINIHIKGGQKKERKDDNGDYINGKEVGVHFKVTPKYYDKKDIKFSVRILFETTLEIKKDKPQTKKSDIRDIKFGKLGKQPPKQTVECELPFILDFDLGPPKKMNADSSRRSGNQTSSQSVSTSGATSSLQSVSETASTPASTSATSDAPAVNNSEEKPPPPDGGAKREVGHKSRGSNELAQQS